MATAVRVNDVVQSWGVNTALTFGNSYANTAEVVSELNYIGIDLIRDHVPGPDTYGQSVFHEVTAAGIKLDLLVSTGGDQNLATWLSDLDLLVQNNPGSVTAIEGSNEINIWPITFNGLSGMAAGASWQKALYNGIKSDPNLAGIPVYSLTLGGGTPDQYLALGNLSAYATYGNAHIYPGGEQSNAPASWFLGPGSYYQYSATDTPSDPTVITEFGYYTTPDNSGGVNQDVQAKYELDALFDAQAAGAPAIYLYELMDGDPTDTYGMFNSDGTPKEAANALHNLTAILQDTGPNAATFATGSLNYSINNLPSTGNSLLMEKSDGAFDIVVWNEPQIWDQNNATEVIAPTSSVTVKLGATYSSVEVFDPLQGTAPIETLSNTGQVQIALTDHPLIVEVEPAAASRQSSLPVPPSINVPASETLTAGTSVHVTGAAVSDPTASTVTVKVSDSTGTLSMTGTSIAPSNTQTFTGSVAAVNAQLANLTYHAGQVAGSDTIDVTAQDTAGNTSSATIPVTVQALTIDVSNASSATTVSKNYETITSTHGGHMIFLYGSNDTVNMSGGHEVIQEHGKKNTFELPAAGKGYDDITGSVFNNGDQFDFRQALAASQWDGQSSDLAHYLKLSHSNGNTVVSISDTGSGGASRVLLLENTTVTMTQLLAHSVV